jgi:hypothetical protein
MLLTPSPSLLSWKGFPGMLKTCVSCEGFVPGSAGSCPHCGAAAPVSAPSALAGFGKSVTALATGGAMAITLMACYGLPPCESGQDADGDGYSTCYAEDCDDTNKDINPLAPDTKGDGIDQNCDGVDGNAFDEEDAGDSGTMCLSCAQAMGTPGATEAQVCEGDALVAFQALKQCACVAACAAVCETNSYCKATESSSDCQSCVSTQCSTQTLDCQEN